jgi:hypothetical protein
MDVEVLVELLYINVNGVAADSHFRSDSLFSEPCFEQFQHLAHA